MNKKRISLLLILFLVIGLSVGYGYGFYSGVKTAIALGLNFVDINVDRELIENAIFNYRNQINDCFDKPTL